MTSMASPDNSARLAVNLGSPIDARSTACGIQPLQGARPLRRELGRGGASSGGNAKASSPWATQLYDAVDDAENPPERIAAVFERAATALQHNEESLADTQDPSGARAHPPAAGTPHSKHKESSGDVDGAKALRSPASVSVCSSQLYKDLEQEATSKDDERSSGSTLGPAARDRHPSTQEDDARRGSPTAMTGSPITAHTPNESAIHANAAPSPCFSMSQAADRKVAWCCGVCGYYVLAMDQNGNPLPFALSAFGDPLPLRCPRCQLEHTAWEPGVPFDPHGDHVNVRSKLSNNYVVADGANGQSTRAPAARPHVDLPYPSVGTTASASSSPAVAAAMARYEKSFQTNSTSLFRYNLLSSLSETHPESARDGTGASQRLLRAAQSASQKENALSRLGLGLNNEGEFNLLSSLPRAKPTHRMAYYCGRCNRRLLRVDAQGELVPMDCDEDGQPLPIVCPGCGACHSDWTVKPFAVRNATPTGKRLY